MSGFSAEWLALREPADHAARDRDLLAATAAAIAGKEPLRVLDLGCGAGSNLRAMAPVLGPHQYWRLVDHDPALLGAAREALRGWADAVPVEDTDGMVLSAAGRRIAVTFERRDLSAGVGPLLDGPIDLVTAAALFDLVSPAWIDAFVGAVAGRGLPFYTALTYDGREAWEPPHAEDAAIHAAFLAHQGRDKGFGPSAGPRAAALLADGFRHAGYAVREADSPWRLAEADAALIAMLAEGIADAVAETGEVALERVAAWRAARRSVRRCLVGHVDILAVLA